MNHPNLSVLF